MTREEVDELTSITKKGKRNARVLKNALILLNVDEGDHGKGKTDQAVAEILRITVQTICNRWIRGSFVRQAAPA